MVTLGVPLKPKRDPTLKAVVPPAELFEPELDQLGAPSRYGGLGVMPVPTVFVVRLSTMTVSAQSGSVVKAAPINIRTVERTFMGIMRYIDSRYTNGFQWSA